VGTTVRRVVRERIDPRLTAALFANYRTPIDAVLELVDNAVDSRVAGRPLELDIAVHPGRLVLVVVGGTGMSPAAIERDYLRWGASSKRSGDRIGRYGQGGKAAIGHLGNRFEVIASAAGDEHAYGFEDAAYRDRARLRTYDLAARKKVVAAHLGYVRIDIGEIDRKLDPRTIAPRPWTVAERHEVSVRAAGRLVRGWWGLLPDPPSPAAPEGGVRLYHLGRLVGLPEWFGHPTPAAHPALNRLVGELEMPHVPVTMNKADVDRGSEVWAAVEARMHAVLAPIVRRLTREPGSAVTPEAARTAEQVRRILAKALRLLEEGRLFESEVAVGGDEPGGQLALDGVRSRADAPDLPAEPDAPDGVDADPGAAGATAPQGGPGARVVAAPRRWWSASSTRGFAAPSSRRTGCAGSSSTAPTRSTRSGAAISGTSSRRRSARSASRSRRRRCPSSSARSTS
jgi:hypothetical protein